jgi:hypothetical protein
MNRHPYYFTGLVLLVLLLSACATSSPDQRIARDSELFESFPAEAQESIRAGKVEVGFTEEMVRMAMGKPERILNRTTEEAAERIFIYARSRPSFSFGIGGSRGGGRTGVGTGVGVSSGGSAEETHRVIFRDGVVYALEEMS